MTESPRTNAVAREADPRPAPQASDESIVSDSPIHSRMIVRDQISSRRDDLPEAEEAGNERHPSSGEDAALEVSRAAGEPGDVDHAGPEQDTQGVFSERIETLPSSGLSEKNIMGDLKSSSKTEPKPVSALIQRNVASDASFSSQITAQENAPTEGGVSDIVGQSDKRGARKTGLYDDAPRSDKSIEPFSTMKESKGADKEDLLVPSNSDRFSHPSAPADPMQSGLSVERGTSFGKVDSATAPIVKVTIGRIEVRAVTQQTPSPRPRTVPAQPKLSLADYLKRRDGGHQ